jgi:DNA mismatch endonuclease (patch repair protein)
MEPCDPHTDPARRALMSKVRRERTSQEEEVAQLCRVLGLSFRRNVRSLPGSPDLANKCRNWAIFVNGCYWHHHTNCDRGSIPARNQSFWATKFSLNRRRDAKNIWILRRQGYRVLVVWQCQLKNKPALIERLSGLAKSSESAIGRPRDPRSRCCVDAAAIQRSARTRLNRLWSSNETACDAK